MSVISLARDLLRIPSPSGEERAIGEFLAARLGKKFKVTKQDVGNRFNILAVIGEPQILLTTHIDTVPGDLPLTENEQFLFGRGACDTKGIIASMICAAEEAQEKGITDFGLVFTVSEETDFLGVEKALSLVNPEFVIVGEPTDLQVGIAQKGLLGIKIKCQGKKAHGAIPEQGKSAIDMLVTILSNLKSIVVPVDKVLGATTMNIGLIKGGTAVNVVADSAEAFVELRTTILNSKVIELLNLNPQTAQVAYSYEPVFAQDISALSKLKLQVMTAPFFSEMYFWAKKSKAVVFGPGEYQYAHSNEERISKTALERAKEIYRSILERKLVDATKQTHTLP